MSSKKKNKKSLKKIQFKQSLMNAGISDKIFPKPFVKSTPFLKSIRESQGHSYEFPWISQYTSKNSKSASLFGPSHLSLQESRPRRKIMDEKKDTGNFSLGFFSEQSKTEPKIGKLTEIMLDASIENFRKNTVPHISLKRLSYRSSNPSISKSKVSQNMFNSSIIPEVQKPQISINEVLNYINFKSRVPFK